MYTASLRWATSRWEGLDPAAKGSEFPAEWTDVIFLPRERFLGGNVSPALKWKRVGARGDQLQASLPQPAGGLAPIPPKNAPRAKFCP